MSQVCIADIELDLGDGNIVRLKPDDYMYRCTRRGAYEVFYTSYNVWVGQKVDNPFEEILGPIWLIASTRRELYKAIDQALKEGYECPK